VSDSDNARYWVFCDMGRDVRGPRFALLGPVAPTGHNANPPEWQLGTEPILRGNSQPLPCTAELIATAGSALSGTSETYVVLLVLFAKVEIGNTAFEEQL